MLCIERSFILLSLSVYVCLCIQSCAARQLINIERTRSAMLVLLYQFVYKSLYTAASGTDRCVYTHNTMNATNFIFKILKNSVNLLCHRSHRLRRTYLLGHRKERHRHHYSICAIHLFPNGLHQHHANYYEKSDECNY